MPHTILTHHQRLVNCGRCPPKKRFDNRPDATKRGYDARWRKLRLAYLTSHPLCELCQGKGKTVAAVLVDHITPINSGGQVLDQSNLRSLCRKCHDEVTSRYINEGINEPYPIGVR